MTTAIAIPTEGKYTYYDRVCRDWAMYLDGQFIGSARTKPEADTTLDSLVDEVARHTRATTADMAAEAAANIDEELAAQGLRLAAEDEAGWCMLTSGGKHVWATDDPPRQDQPVVAPLFEEETAPYLATLPRTIDELRAELDNITDIISEAKRRGEDWSHLRERRTAIITALDAAHEQERLNQVVMTASYGSDVPEPWHQAAWREDWHQRHPAATLAADIDTLGLPEPIASMLIGTPDPRCKKCGKPADVFAGGDFYCKPCWHGPRACSSCGDPLTVCPARQESGEVVPYAALGDDTEGAAVESCPGLCGPCGKPATKKQDEHDQDQGRYRDADDLTAMDRLALARMAADGPCSHLRALLREALTELERYHRDAQDRADEYADDYARRHGDDPSFQAGIAGMMSYEVPELPLIARIRAALA